MSKLNAITVIVVFLVIIRHVVNIFQIPMQMMMSESIELSIYEMAQSTIMIVVLFAIILCKKWALIGFYVFQILNAVILPFFTHDYLETFVVSISIALMMSCFLSLLLLLKRSKISGWRVFFPKKQENNVSDTISIKKEGLGTYNKSTPNDSKIEEVSIYSKEKKIQIIKETFCSGIKYDIYDIERKLKELGYCDFKLSNSHIRIGDSEYEGFYFNGCTWSFTPNRLLSDCSLVSVFKDKAITMAMQLKQYLSEKHNFFEAGVDEIYRYDYRGNGFGIILKVGCEGA